MNTDTVGATFRRTGRTTAELRAAAAMALLVLVGACGGRDVAPVRTPSSGVGQPSDDVVGVFAARASPHEEARVVLPDGRPATLRMVRRYAAASGRDCSEILVSTAAAQRTQIVCRGEQGAWLAARPLLRGG